MKKSAVKAKTKAAPRSGSKSGNEVQSTISGDPGSEIASPFLSALELVNQAQDGGESQDELEQFAAKFETAAQLLSSAIPNAGIPSSGSVIDDLVSKEFGPAANDSDEPNGRSAEFQPVDDGEGIEASDGDEAAPDVPLVSSVSALLFVSTRPLTLNALCRASRASKEQVMEALDKLSQTLEEQALGITLVEAAGAYQLRSAPKLAAVVKRLIRQRERRLSRAAAETLAVVAYKQPVGRAEIEAIRGVDALPTLKTLLEARLIRIVGRDTSVGHPALFGTTEKFLERFGLSDLSDLMSMKEIEQLVREPGEAGSEEDVAGQELSQLGAEPVAAISEHSAITAH